MKDYFIRMKNKYVIGLLILATIGLSAVYAQLPEQRPLSRLTISDILRYVNKYSVIYIEKVVQREKRGDFPLNPDEAKEVQRSIEDVMSALQRVDDSGSVFPKGLSPESKFLLTQVLECTGCQELNALKVKVLPETAKDLKRLLNNRCQIILDIIASAKESLSKNAVFKMDFYMGHLRQLTLAHIEEA